ncbi:hypothetical protein IRJ41_011746 [Triplophysa rosa]|uniref:Uncharacterized protein n=1 Tax=Triplophysa rosa TaxID=992332 RepID=A0A9W7T5R6_TRIRA|nr:hypothetical protein IRJ41_011746 [Triplophysa rosa]
MPKEFSPDLVPSGIVLLRAAEISRSSVEQIACRRLSRIGRRRGNTRVLNDHHSL